MAAYLLWLRGKNKPNHECVKDYIFVVISPLVETMLRGMSERYARCCAREDCLDCQGTPWSGDSRHLLERWEREDWEMNRWSTGSDLDFSSLTRPSHFQDVGTDLDPAFEQAVAAVEAFFQKEREKKNGTSSCSDAIASIEMVTG